MNRVSHALVLLCVASLASFASFTTPALAQTAPPQPAPHHGKGHHPAKPAHPAADATGDAAPAPVPSPAAPVSPPASIAPSAPAPLPPSTTSGVTPGATPTAIATTDPVPPPPAPAPHTTGTFVELTTLRILLEKGVISRAEYESAVRDMGDSVGASGAGDANSVVVAKWATTLYGFVEADSIYDSTQSLNDIAGGAQIARPDTYAGSRGRTQFAIRDSRFGFRLKAPEVKGIRASGLIEVDFFGNQLPIGPNNGNTVANLPTASGTTGSGTSTEAQFFTNPAMRVRHAYMKVETPIVDLLFGQYWNLLGWQNTYAPSTVEIIGIPGELYSRTPQIRISKTISNDTLTFEAALAALRPSQRDSALPNGQAGVRLSTPLWSGLTTSGGTGTSIQPLSIAITGDARRFTLPSYDAANTANPNAAVSKFGTSIAIDAFIPILAAKKKQGNALSVTGEFSTGYGNADVYTQFSSGAPAPSYPAAKGQSAASADVDPGLVVYDNLGNIHLVELTSFWLSARYYLPIDDGNVWVTANFSSASSSNLPNGFGTPSKVRKQELWYDANVFWAPTEAYRVGLEAAMFDDEYVDGVHAKNLRVHLANYFIF